jgi:hypothetical protein
MTTTPHAQIIEENCESCKAVTQGSLRASAIQNLNMRGQASNGSALHSTFTDKN